MGIRDFNVTAAKQRERERQRNAHQSVLNNCKNG